jgi:hypothetical protein
LTAGAEVLLGREAVAAPKPAPRLDPEPVDEGIKQALSDRKIRCGVLV